MIYQGSKHEGPLPAGVVSIADLRRLFSELQAKAQEIGEKTANGLKRPPDQSEEQFQGYQNWVRQLFAVTFAVNGGRGEQAMYFSADALDLETLPEPIESIHFDTSVMHKMAVQRDPLDRAAIFFDFRRPPLIDLSNVSGTPPPNNSSYFVIGANSTWVSAVHEAILKIISRRQSPLRSMIYRRHAYDALLVVLGLPMSLWASARLGALFDSFAQHAQPLPGLMRVYFFLLALLTFRLLFSVARWLYPYIELEGSRIPGMKTRLLFHAVVLSTVARFAYDVGAWILRGAAVP
ncbi:MAG: hypothetical protein OZ948_15105 [Deltaproteobacteria bacterium]|nr:hypothetical protein [Deltaproteobacteria bacterium]